ncbi:hypothetical protein HKT18_00925 [Flavobacterium sp. IMCC34852]|uniref:Uncharacterized protein n=1 Tax=Flavobacterium rivulicola TaxID=2732161 RepID=A0A7Y3R6K9_9FLAO|nr:hypothetical protein [Flavobacterium sp. IMCC34852]NNT70766.1 hypothetical protein [Flavobacterium sp. IMCC34852]
MKFIICFLFSITAFTQTKPIELKIDSINSTETEDGRREFKLQYHITNLSDKAISFILNTKSLIPIGAGSLNPAVYYKLYENENSIDVSGIFTGERKIRSFKNETELKKYTDSLMNYMKSRTPEQLSQIRKEGFLENIQKLAPKETKYLTAIFAWDKKRYHKNDVIEYYIEEKEKHFFELHINLMAEELLMNFSEEEKKELLKDKVLTKGWFTSNKMEIDLSE